MKKNVFGKALCALALGIFCLNAKGQNEQENLKKYWNYRDKYHKQFVKIGLGDGKSISAANIDNNPSNLSAEKGSFLIFRISIFSCSRKGRSAFLIKRWACLKKIISMVSF